MLDLDRLHTLFNIYIHFLLENTNDDLMEYYGTEWPNESISPRRHVLEDHATNFVEKWKNSSGMQDGESIYNEFNQFKITYCWMPSASKRLKMMLQEHYMHIHAES